MQEGRLYELNHVCFPIRPADSNTVQRLCQIRNNVRFVFNADRDAHQSVGNPELCPSFLSDRGMCHRGRMANQRLHAAKRLGEETKPQSAREAIGILQRSGLDRNHGAKAALLALRKFVLRVVTVTVTAKGFDTGTYTGIILNVDQNARVDASLKTGSVNQTVAVDATAIQIQSEDAVNGKLLSGRELQELPSNNRNIWQEAQYLPQVSADPPSDSLANRGGFIVAGIVASNNNYLLDGNDDNDWTTGQPTLRPSTDAVSDYHLNERRDIHSNGFSRRSPVAVLPVRASPVV